MAALLFMSARPILGHLSAHFRWFSSKLPEIASFRWKLWFFGNFEYFYNFIEQNSVWGNFQF